MIKPPRLREGDTFAVLSPSAGAPSAFPHVFDDGLAALRELFGFRIKEYPSARLGRDELHENPRLRAEDLNRAFLDPEVQGIVASIGGDDSVRILEHLDVPAILANPKPIMGYSDSTTFLAYLNMKGLVTYYGNSVMAGFGYLREFPEAVEEYRRVLFTAEPYELRAFPAWADRYRDWKDPANVGRVAELRRDDVGHRWLNKGAVSKGRLWGGCVEVLEMMNGTFAWPGGDFWNGRILFLETSEDKPTPTYVGYVLRNFGVQGILRQISGLLVARPKAYTPDEKEELDREILRIVVGEFGRGDLNIVSNLDFGHTDPRHILPYGVELGLDPEAERLVFLEGLFAD